MNNDPWLPVVDVYAVAKHVRVVPYSGLCGPRYVQHAVVVAVPKKDWIFGSAVVFRSPAVTRDGSYSGSLVSGIHRVRAEYKRLQGKITPSEKDVSNLSPFISECIR